MKVLVVCFLNLATYTPVNGEYPLSPGLTVGGLLDGLDIPGENVRTVFVNGLHAEFHELTDCHDVHVRLVEHKILVSCHCTMEGNLRITDIHDVTAALEDRIKERFPQIARVTIHPEPQDAPE